MQLCHLFLLPFFNTLFCLKFEEIFEDFVVAKAYHGWIKISCDI